MGPVAKTTTKKTMATRFLLLLAPLAVLASASAPEALPRWYLPGSNDPRKMCERQRQGFYCDNGKCLYQIKKASGQWVMTKTCDGINDCGDWSDERPSKCGPRGCRDDQFYCDNGLCLDNPDEIKCNGNNDCWDNSDERGCGPTCSSDEFHCPGDDMCVPDWYRCDDEVDCNTDGADEESC